MLVDLIVLFQYVQQSTLSTDLTFQSSWMDRIPLVLLFGVATSVELLQERLTKSASRCLSGVQVDVEQTSSVIERIFRRAVASSDAVLQLGPEVLSMLMERQLDHPQSVQSFIAAIKVSLTGNL